MRALDCYDLNSTVTSLANLLSTDPQQLRAALAALRWTDFEAGDFGYNPAPKVLWNHIVGPDTVPLTPDLVYWFHATRVPPDTDFAEGIQHLMERLPKIRDLLTALAALIDKTSATLPPPWTHNGGFHYNLKTSDPIHWGPHGFLVRDAIVHKGAATHDYLATPEIVEDLAEAIAGKWAAVLVEEFRKATRPCIVKFASAEPRADVVRVALYYAYSTLWAQDQNTDTNTNFAAKGQTIPFSDIVQIEYPVA
jgi:hypothetical protein